MSKAERGYLSGPQPKKNDNFDVCKICPRLGDRRYSRNKQIRCGYDAITNCGKLLSYNSHPRYSQQTSRMDR